MSDKLKHLQAGGTRPDETELDRFWDEARAKSGAHDLPDDYRVRRIGADASTTRAILDHIRNGDKTGTVSVPWAVERSGEPRTDVGDAIILIDFDGTPSILVRIEAVDVVAYGDISEKQTALDGPRVRALDVWKAVHVGYFNQLLEPWGLCVTDETPIAFERFDVVYAP